MAIDPRKLRPGALCRLLNSTPLGEVINERQLHRHRTRAGFRISPPDDPNRVDLFRYTAWLATTVHERRRRAAEAPEGVNGYDAYRDRKTREARALSLSGRDISPLPEVADPERKASCRRDFRAFCERYFPSTFHLAWSEDHLKVIAKIERAVLEGGLFAMAMPRGSGKTSLCETACLWAMLYGHREFVALIGSDEDHAAQMLDSIKAELENSELLAADFPEVCHPIRSLEGIHQRAAGQLLDGRPTLIGWTAKEIVLPTCAESEASGAIIRVAGITGRIRGMKHKRADGSSVRPSLVLIDDPQTDESARSPSQCVSRERVLAGAILGLAGPGQKIAGLMTVTVVRPDDLADRLLDRDKHPAWQGERTKMVYSFPTNEKLWDEYARLRADGLRHDRGIREATAFYKQNRTAMDEGAVVAWASRFNHDELSAVQHAMNLRLQDEHAFFAEYQNEPLPEATGIDDDLPDADAIAARVNNHERGLAPLAATRLTMFIDVQGKCLFWLVAAWEEDFTGCVVDYGTEPEQKAASGGYFTLRDVRYTLQAAAKHAGLEGAIYAGLERLCERTVGREWKRDGGATARIDRCLIDANWGASTDVVYQFCRQSPFAGVVMPAHGRYVGASSVPFGEYKRKRGERIGLNWRIPATTGRRAVRHALFDANWWKSFVFARLATFLGLDRQDVRIDPVRLTAGAESVWEGEVSYGLAASTSTGPPLSEGESAFSFDTGGATQRITQSIATVGTFPAPGETAPDFQGAIGVSENGVEGVEIPIPALEFTETHVFASTFVTDAYKAQVAQTRGKTNSLTFRGFAPGELLFLGASGSKRGDGKWEITYRFSTSPNRTGFAIGPIAGVNKKGWEHIWVLHEEKEDATAERVVKRPVAAYVEQVFESADFAAKLGI